MGTSATVPQQQPEQSTWEIDPAHSAAHFSVRHLMISNVHGEFSKLKGYAVIHAADATKSNVAVSLDTASINTREPQRDEDLRSAAFFDVADHPTITFQSKQVTAVAQDHFKVTGELTIRGVTKDVTFDVEGPTPEVKDPWGNVRLGVTATARISRKEFGLVTNPLMEGGGVVIGDQVSITIEAELVRKAAA